MLMFLGEQCVQDLDYLSPDLSISVACVMEPADRMLPLVGPLAAEGHTYATTCGPKWLLQSRDRRGGIVEGLNSISENGDPNLLDPFLACVVAWSNTLVFCHSWTRSEALDQGIFRSGF